MPKCSNTWSKCCIYYLQIYNCIFDLISRYRAEERAATGISLGGQESSFVTRPRLGAQMVLTIGENIMDQLCEICHCLPNTAVNNSENFLLNLLPPHRMLHQVRCQSLRLMIKDSSKCAEPNRKLTREIFQESSKLFYDIDNGGCKLPEFVHRLNIRVAADRRSLTALWRTNCLQFTAGIMGETRLGTWDQAVVLARAVNNIHEVPTVPVMIYTDKPPNSMSTVFTCPLMS